MHKCKNFCRLFYISRIYISHCYVFHFLFNQKNKYFNSLKMKIKIVIIDKMSLSEVQIKIVYIMEPKIHISIQFSRTF